MKFSDNLRILRAEYRLTQQDIGDIVGLTAQAVSKWENNLAEPDNESLKKLAKHFNVSVDYLLGIKKEKETNRQKLRLIETEWDSLNPKQIETV